MWNVLSRGPVLCWGRSPRYPPMAARNKVCTSGHESRWHVNKSLDMNMYKCIKKCIQWAFMNYDMIILWYIYVLVEFIMHDLWDMPALAELRLTTYVRVVGTKVKYVSNIWVWDAGVVGLWKVGMDNLTMHTHFAFDTFIYLPFYDCFYYVSNSILFMVLVCKYSFEHVL